MKPDVGKIEDDATAVAAGLPAGLPSALPERLPKEPLAMAVARGLRDAILEGEFSPNDRIKQEEVAERFGVSRSPVREAFRELASEGLVELERDVGARVTPFTNKDLLEVYLAREALEPLMIEAACREITDEEFAEVKRLNRESEMFAERGDIAGYLRLDTEMHHILLQASRMTLMYDIAAKLWSRTMRYRFAYTNTERLSTSVLEHRLLLDAIEVGDSIDAADIYRVHTRRTRLTLARQGYPRELTEGRSSNPREINPKGQ